MINLVALALLVLFEPKLITHLAMNLKIMENDLLKKEITCLTNDLRKCYDSRAKFNHCWASQV